MRNYKRFDLLEAVELWGSDNGCAFTSEAELSAAFDEQIAPLVIEVYGADDIPAMSEAFSNWCDSLAEDNLLHPEQVQNYCYVGKYADEG